MTNEESLTDIYKIIGDFCDCAQRDLELRLSKWPTDLARNEVHEVIGALLARQVSLASELAKSPGAWTDHIAPLVLRAMADAHITLAWLLNDPTERCRKFIHYGLGQAKLHLEHRRAELSTRTPQQGEVEALDAFERSINSQRVAFLTDVNLGSWSGISTRTMAEQAGCLDFYNFVYSPFSACAHSTWQHIFKYNLKGCENPLHQYHSAPYAPDLPIEPHYLYLGGKYLQKSLSVFDEVMELKTARKSAFDHLCDALDALGDGESDVRSTSERAI